jgi:hypothetical protein
MTWLTGRTRLRAGFRRRLVFQVEEITACGRDEYPNWRDARTEDLDNLNMLAMTRQPMVHVHLPKVENFVPQTAELPGERKKH